MSFPDFTRHCLLPLQGVTNECALTQGVASLALGYALVGLSARLELNPKL